ncbi:hypothetical protein AVEN_58908-1 [Araneus ventricosus]|uniref:TRP C-terminal domain-containing protein n=1 Tax=Araneus ventricosus TaxID=182803 RepID=A0A4Y2ET70_ARAVE|nr:hypothetical protein AVEN_58908-1 [Araneus ventricosus]
MDLFFWMTAFMFAFLGQQTGIPKNQHYVFVCFQMLLETFIKALLAQLMSIITWKALQYMQTANTQRRGLAMTGLTVIHVMWIFLTNLCVTCKLTLLETVVAVLEFLSLLVIGAFVLRCVITVLRKIWLHFNGAAIPQEESPPSETGILSNQVRDTTQPITQADLLSSSPNSGNSASSFGAAGVSPISGIPYCHHKAPFTTPRNMDTATSSRQAKPNNSLQRILSSSPNEGPPLNLEGNILERKTRSGAIYNRMSSGLIKKA